jgi:NAD(P)-dependent dehydrogenase (short-subunit alcohol dehydrogenase family)
MGLHLQHDNIRQPLPRPSYGAKNGGGSIIYTESIAGVMPCFAFICHRASRAAIINFTKSTAIDLAEYGIRVNPLAPGSIKPPATDFRNRFSGS